MSTYRLGSGPSAETVPHVGTPAVQSCHVFRSMLKRLFPSPEGIHAKYPIFTREGATGYECYVVLSAPYEDEPDTRAYVDEVLSHLPTTWDAQALADLQSDAVARLTFRPREPLVRDQAPLPAALARLRIGADDDWAHLV
jgi:hypothetical protein